MKGKAIALVGVVVVAIVAFAVAGPKAADGRVLSETEMQATVGLWCDGIGTSSECVGNDGCIACGDGEETPTVACDPTNYSWFKAVYNATCTGFTEGKNC